jgi:hypothetical protein
MRLHRCRRLAPLVLAALFGSADVAAPPRKAPAPKPQPAGPAAALPPASPLDPWLRVEYGTLVDRRKLTHSGEPVGYLLAKLGGRSFPAPGERPDDELAFRLLDPVLEPYGFVLIDALDAIAPPFDPPLSEVGALWEAGERQPAWAELCRARFYILESDGEGRLRAILPSTSLASLPYDDALPASDPVAAAKQAWEEAWPVLRHALAAERRRLARLRGGASPPLDVEVHAYRHLLSREAFVLGAAPFRTRVEDTGGASARPPLDLAKLASVLDRGDVVEGGRIEPGGTLVWLTSPADAKPTILGRKPTLADLAVAYRAVAHGGLSEPFMSLDRGAAPHLADVNYGGRLRDTALGMASLLSDVRFKTWSVGVDLLGAGDVRAAIRRTLPEFATHLERFASDPASGAALDQKTRFWFYPDEVDLTVSADFDLLAFRKARMTATSERVKTAGAPAIEPTWTRQTTAFLNAHHEELPALFPEIGELDTSARFLALFTWLDAAKGRGLPVPDLDVLMAMELPAVPTPRRFPELLSYDVLPPPGGASAVDVFDRTAVGDALERLAPRGAKPLSAVRRFERARAMLDRRLTDQAALLDEMAALAGKDDVDAMDQDSYRAERLLMHARVLATLPADDAARVAARRTGEPGARVFSVGIGGIDLDMRAALARATLPGMGALSMGGRGLVRAPSAPSPAPAAPAGAPKPASADPALVPAIELPDHGLGPETGRTTVTSSDGRGTIVLRRLPGARVARGTWRAADGGTIAWQEVDLGDEGPEMRARRRVGGPDGKAPTFERVEDGRWLGYRFERVGAKLRAVPAFGAVPATILDLAAAGPDAPPASAEPAIPEGLAILSAGLSAAGGTVTLADPPTVRLRIRGAGGRDVSAEVPRGILQRLVLGREADVAPDRPLPGFTPASQVLLSATTLMVQQSEEEIRPPWSGPIDQLPGEEDAARLASALQAWWGADPSSREVHAIVGTDAALSTARWTKVPRFGGPISVVAPEDAFPGLTAPVLGRIAAAGSGAGSATAVLVVSAEPAGLLGRRLRALSRDPDMQGKVLAVVSLGGPLRGDLAASFLREGRLAALGVFEAGPVGLERAADRAAAWARAATEAGSKGRRPEEIPGPFTWFY